MFSYPIPFFPKSAALKFFCIKEGNKNFFSGGGLNSLGQFYSRTDLVVSKNIANHSDINQWRAGNVFRGVVP